MIGMGWDDCLTDICTLSINGKHCLNILSSVLAGGDNWAKWGKNDIGHHYMCIGLSMDPLLLNDCPIYIFSGLGGHGLSFFILGQ